MGRLSPFQFDFVELRQVHTIACAGFANLAPGLVIDGNSLSLAPGTLPSLGLAGDKNFVEAFRQLAALDIVHQLVNITIKRTLAAENRGIKQCRRKTIADALTRGATAAGAGN